MANINLLPWREARRAEKQQEFYMVILFSVMVAGFLVYLVNSYYEGAIADQEHRNNYILRETAVLDKRIEEISTLQGKRKELVERMDLIQALQGNRPVIVRVFDEIARTVPDDLYFKSLAIKGGTVLVSGIAKSNNRVAALMRNFDDSQWFADPELQKVLAVGDGVNEFEITMIRIEPSADKDKEAH